MIKGLSLVKYIVICLLFIAAVVGGLFYFDAQSYVLRLFDWLDGLGAWAPLLFILIEMVVVVFVLPGIIFTLGAGFLFGVLKGSLYVVIGTTLGATIAFITAKHFFGERASMFLLSHPKLKIVDEEFRHEGWKFILLTRLVPFFPFKLSNYFFGVTQFSLRDFFFGSLFGIMPITIFNVYIGSLSADLATLGLRSSSRSKAEWIIYGIGFVISIGALVYITRMARKALTNYISKEKLH
ncbi:MAG: TVP38/TMEM64 family protein [Deltaproteobacteria bacterium]|nr:TVP38/TMEM64 family protein [Deltaproteobacteria bacterium]